MREEIKELCEALGWIDLGPQKNIYMMSFREEETGRRVNIYPTTMTVTVEDINHIQKHYHDVTLEKLEQILA